MFNFIFSVLFFMCSVVLSASEDVKTTKLEGRYKVSSVEVKNDYTVVYFEKLQKTKTDKIVYIELTSYNRSFMDVGTILEMTAEVIDSGNNAFEAKQILVNRQRGEGVFLLSRKGNLVNFEKATYSKMNNIDFKIF